MFTPPRYIRNSFAISFPRYSAIRRKANDFEDILKGHYVQPHIISVPDDLDAEVPRMIFGSKHGFSQIIVSQVNLVLNVTYSPDWQVDISKGRQYLLDRVPILFELLEILKETKPYFCGLTTVVRLPSKADAEATLDYMTRLLSGGLDFQNLYDIQLKTTVVALDRFFSNITLRSYYEWKPAETQQGIPRFSRKEALERGIEIEGDLNDRYRFNEDANYFSSQGAVEDIINRAFDEIRKVIERARDSQS